MKPLFTVHGGEYLVGSYIEQNYANVKLWIPSRDTGIDLLVTDSHDHSPLSIQVKFSKDWLVTHMKPEFHEPLRACGWWKINRDKLSDSPADYWVFVLLGFKRHSTDYIVMPIKKLQSRLTSIHGSQKKEIQCGLWVTETKKCWEARGLPVGDQRKIADDSYQNPTRNLTKWLNNWSPLSRLND
jgi:hypothetical protein